MNTTPLETSPDELTEDELAAIEKLLERLSARQAGQQYEAGLAAGLPATSIVNLAAPTWAFLKGARLTTSLVDFNGRAYAEQFALLVSQAIINNDAQLFEQIATILRCRAEGVPLRELSAKDLGLQRAPGRKAKPYDLSRVFVIAAMNVVYYRCRKLMDEVQQHTERLIQQAVSQEEQRAHRASSAQWQFTSRRISRDELLSQIQQLRERFEVDFPAISQAELSRWITKTGLKPFMEKRSKSTKRESEKS